MGAKALILLASLLALLPFPALAMERCQNLAQEVRSAHSLLFGTDFPSHYSVGQLQQESNCRDVISRDGVGSEGPAQITYRLWKDALARKGITEIRTTKNHLRAQAFINKCAYNEARVKKLWIAYQIYNGGGLVNKEIQRAGKPDWALAKAQCRRKIVHFRDGSSESACDINYDYSRRVYRYGNAYRTASDGAEYSFW
jgi:hypothetical protein